MSMQSRVKRDLREVRRLEKICSAEAELASMDLERIGLLKVAEDCRRAAQELEAQLPSHMTRAFGQNVRRVGSKVELGIAGHVIWALVLAGLALFVALYLPW